MTIDIYESRELVYSQRRFIRNVTLAPTTSNLSISRFNWGNGEVASVTLDLMEGVRPRNITYVVIKDNGTETHYYVIGFQYINAERYELSLKLNPWIGVARDRRAFIKRGRNLPDPLQKIPEPGFTSNKIPAYDIPVTDVFGSGKNWGILFMNRVASDADPLQVELSNIEYNIRGSELPVSPDEPRPGTGGSGQIAFYDDYVVTSSPTPPSNIQTRDVCLYSQETLDLGTVRQLPNLNNTYYAQTTEVSGYHTKRNLDLENREFEGLVVLPFLGEMNQAAPFVRWGVVTLEGCVIEIGADGKVSSVGGTPRILFDSGALNTSSAVDSAGALRKEWLNQNYSGNYQAVVFAQLDNLSNRSVSNGSVTQLSMLNDLLVGYPVAGTATPAANPAPLLEGRTLAAKLSAGPYYASNASIYDYTFLDRTSKPSGSMSIYTSTNRSARQTWGDSQLTRKEAFIAANDYGRAEFSPVYYGTIETDFSTTINYQTASQGAQRYQYTTTRRTYNFSLISQTTVTCSGLSGTNVYQNQELTKQFVLLNKPTNVSAWFMVQNNSVVEFNNPGIQMPTASQYISQGVNAEFTLNNVTYIRREAESLDGFYKVGQTVYKVTGSELDLNTTAPMSYNVMTPSYDSNTFGLQSNGISTAEGTAAVTLRVTHLGEPETVDTVLDVQLDNTKINNGTVLSEPYAILAIPLFETKYALEVDANGNPTQIKTSLPHESQRAYYEFIRTYSGGSGQVADSQVIPYAPEIFKTSLRNTVEGQWIDMSNMNRIGTQSTGQPMTSIPFVVLSSNDINIDFYCNIRPYADQRKEATLRKFRLRSPNLDAALDCNYYDFNNEITDWGAERDHADTLIRVSITLKPFGTYMRAFPYVRDNTLMGASNRNHELRGIICGGGQFQSSMTSSAFETFRRENTMFEQIQQRRVETLQLEQRAERGNEIVQSVVGSLQGAYYGAAAGNAAADFKVFGVGGGAAGGIAGGLLGGAVAGTAYGLQIARNDELRAREREDLKFYYEADLANVRAQPDTITRISGFNQDILRMFSIVIEVYAPTEAEARRYDDHINDFSHSMNVVDNLANQLVHGSYVEGILTYSDEPPHIHNRLNEDLQRGGYFYNEI